MPKTTWLLLLVGAVLASAPSAAAQPANPPSNPGAPDFTQVIPGLQPGSFSYPYNVIVVGPPPATDSRGTRVSAGVDKDMKADGLPGSALGNSPQAGGPLVSSNARYGISAGLEPAAGGNPGLDIRAGVSAVPSGEDPSGQPPQAPVPIESGQPDELATPGGYPAPILETPGTIREGPTGVFGPQPQ
ncbi:hypothetical protein [Mycolicibacterium iranicum]|uniref:MPT63-like domain-containing protein n=1 Tax=Mycolicibacterium iranicum TaxID=912594 RepID=A0A178M167_MYCIR|nr:hypothetical protein [Mycolicibacterium iranicum]OAN41719.1 hypothetical protein A4X20_02295 [Mycolicibacterium iranicum]